MSRKNQAEQKPFRYYMLNKPTGCVSACRDAEHKTVIDFFPEAERDRLFPMGRLDKSTEGILLITNDGKLNRIQLDPKSHMEKQYLLWAAGTLDEDSISRIKNGLIVKGISQPLKSAQIHIVERSTLGELPVKVFENRKNLVSEFPDFPAFCAELILTEGKRHQVKRMMEAIGCTVVYLKRVSFGGIPLDESLRPGEYRSLTESEIEILKGGVSCTL